MEFDEVIMRNKYRNAVGELVDCVI
jgi:hypothetical protein